MPLILQNASGNIVGDPYHLKGNERTIFIYATSFGLATVAIEMSADEINWVTLEDRFTNPITGVAGNAIRYCWPLGAALKIRAVVTNATGATNGLNVFLARTR